MIQRAFLSILLMLFVGLAVATAGELSGTFSLGVGHACDGQYHYGDSWFNPTTQTIYLKDVTLWIGMGFGSQADTDVVVWRQSDGLLIHYFGWDHYAQPTGPHQVWRSFAPDYIRLAPGDSIGIRYFCASVNGGPTSGHGAAWGFYTVGSP